MCDYKTLGNYQENYVAEYNSAKYVAEYNSAKFDIFKNSSAKLRVGGIDPSISTLPSPDFQTGDLTFKADALDSKYDITSVNLFMRYDSLASATNSATTTLWSPAIPGVNQYFTYNKDNKTITIRSPGTNLRPAAPSGYISPVDPVPFARIYLTWGTTGTIGV